ncbi:MAG: aminopeptidase [Candidatus Rifleibacteriota bacterium]
MTDNFKENISNWLAENETGWNETIVKIRNLQINDSGPWASFFTKARHNLLNSYDFVQMFKQDPSFKSFTHKELQAKNNLFYSEIFSGEKGYDLCFANPDYAVKTFGKEPGQVLSTIYKAFRQSLFFARIENYSEMRLANELFLNIFKIWKSDRTDYKTIFNAYKEYKNKDLKMRSLNEYYCQLNPGFDLYRELISKSDFSDPRYLYRYGMYVDTYTEKLADFLNNYPEDELIAIARNHVNAYLKSFSHKNQDYHKKKFAKIRYPFGMEKLGFLLGEELKKAGLTPVYSPPASRGANEQYGYDHRFETGLYLDSEYAGHRLEYFTETVNYLEERLKLVSGNVVVWLFGQEPFVPEIKENVVQLSEEQDKISHNLQNERTRIFFKAAPPNETSFSIISFPSPEIGENFEKIFKDTLELNNLDSNHYEKIQEKMIEILDQATHVEVKGKEGNETNIRVQMQPLDDPSTQTNFINCGADVNIPVGEIFTSPKLTGTEGILHVKDIFLFGLRYFNLKITFKDGMVTDYSCTNFEKEEDNRKYMFDNLLKPNKTLPIGEFAIGTNTLAYKMAQKHKIQHLLPILIVEKMGPHFAIGDTCFAHEEDSPQKSVISGKSMIATDNEKSALRKTDPSKAYTHKHIDITLPYDMLAEITAVKKDGSKVPIILDGRFVVKGTEELNIPLDNM